ncbi:TIGR04104 family putative zinc finger protein [Halobacillus sp. B23F22_1]|uniref:TIGR04104 family putative zinc finger protein n=1 Tax=Halobacillus sp. B23F22_1 TaxID=3459514 RepID=UPI00373EAB55
MPTCQECKVEWSWYRTIKQALKLKSKITCGSCGQRQYLSEKSQFKHAMLSVNLSIILVSVYITTDASIILNIVFFIIGITILSITSPFITELSSNKEQL